MSLRLVLCCLAGLFILSDSLAVPANPAFAIYQQPDGTFFEARIRGDELFNWHETLTGYPIELQPETAWWVYRHPPDVTNMTTLIVGRDEPHGEPWTPEAPPAVRQRMQRATLDASSIIPVVTKRGVRSTGGAGSAKLLTACVRFSDSPAAGSLTPVSYFQQMIYGRTSDRRTVTDYYQEVSGGKLAITGEVFGWLNLPGTTADYGGNDGNSFSLPRFLNLVSNTVQAMRANGVNFGDYDADLDGFVDCLAVVFQGLGEADGGSANTIWPHQYTYSELKGAAAGSAGLPTGSVNANGQPVFVDLYFTASELNRNSSNMAVSVSAPIGTFCHEFAHALGMPDFYDQVAPVSRGLGEWSLMAFGTYANGYGQAGDCPTWIDPYNRIKAGWDTEVNLAGNVLNARIPEVHDERVVYRLWTEGARGDEYFLIENRKRKGFNLGQPGEGLLIYHVDESVTTGNNQEWWIADGKSRISRGNFLVALEQADGLFELERAVDRGDADDPFTSGDEFADYTIPNSKVYNQPGTYREGPASFVAVRNINTDGPDAAYADLYVFEDTWKPNLYVYQPWNGQVLDALAEASGYVADDRAVTELFVKLRENSPGGRFFNWTLDAWVDSFSASCINDITPQENWSLAINNALLEDGTAYELTVTARDVAGNQAEEIVTFVIDRQLYSPSLIISSPNGETYAEPPLIQGESSSPAGASLAARRFALYSESLSAWYRWSNGIFDSAVFDFGAHVDEVAGNETSWTYALPSNLVSGSYQIHAQSLNSSNRASAWTYKSFRLARAPTVNISSHTHQALLPSMGALSGYAAPQSGYELDGFVRITIYREGLFWTGSYWTNTQATLLASVGAGGGAWSLSEGSIPADDGLYAISASVTDNFGSTSLPVAGGSYNQNNILLRIDGTPPEISIQWPPPGYTSTVSRLPANAFAGSASDRSGQPVVRGTIRRVSDGAYWSNYGWIHMREQAMFTASYPGGDGGSFSEWKLDPELPGAGFNTAWCMPNGDYELIVVATDAIGNTNEVTRAFTVQYESPLFAGLPATDFSPAQDPLNTNAFAMVAVTAVPPFSVAAEQPEGYHGLFAAANGSYRVLAGTLQFIGFGYSSRDPVLYAADSTGNLAVTPVTNTIEYAENYFYERNAGTPVADFRADGAGVTASTLLERDYGYGGPYRFVTKSEITRFDGTGNILWQVLTPPTNYTGWAGYASGPAGLNVKWMKLLDDDRVVVVAEFYGYRNSTYSNYRHHVLCLILNAGGQVVSANRFGVETEDEYRQENEFFIDAAVDGAGNVFVATRGNTGGQPSHYLRKIRLSDGALSGEYAMDTCTSPEWWSAIAVDAAGWVFVGGAVDTGDGQPRLLVTRLDPIDLTRDWRAYGPANSGGPSVAQGLPVRMPLLRSLNGSVYVVHDHDGSSIYDVNDDRIYATRFDPSGQLMWCREIDHLDGSYTRGNQAGYGVLTPAGDILFTGEFDLSSFPYKQGYVKIAANGDLQFARSIGLTNVVVRSVTSDRQRIALALGGPGQPLAVVELDNPANMHPAQGSTYAQWVYEQSLSGAGALPDAMPTGDGVANLMRYASNLGAWEPAATLVPGAGTRGLPDMRTSGAGEVLRLRVEYLRRLNDSNLIYQVQFAPDLRSQGLWENAISSATRTAIDADWERVVVEDHVAGANATSRFSRVKVQLLQP